MTTDYLEVLKVFLCFLAPELRMQGNSTAQYCLGVHL